MRINFSYSYQKKLAIFEFFNEQLDKSKEILIPTISLHFHNMILDKTLILFKKRYLSGLFINRFYSQGSYSYTFIFKTFI